MDNQDFSFRAAALSLTLVGCSVPLDKQDSLEKIEDALAACSHFASEEPFDFERGKEIYEQALKSCAEAKQLSDDLILSHSGDDALPKEIYALTESYIIQGFDVKSLDEFLQILENAAKKYRDKSQYVRNAIAEGDPDVLSKLYFDEHGICRGSSGDSPDTQSACDNRSKISEKLRELNYCLNSDEQEWGKCLSQEEKFALSRSACEEAMKEIAYTSEMNYRTRGYVQKQIMYYDYHTTHTHPNWKAKYGDNYIHSYVTFRMKYNAPTGSPQFKLCIVSKDTLEVLGIENTDIVA